MEKLKRAVDAIECSNPQVEDRWTQNSTAVRTLFELHSDEHSQLRPAVLDSITSSVKVQDALAWCILQTAKHPGLEHGYEACRLLNQAMFERLVPNSRFAVELGRRNKVLIVPKKTAALTVLMEQHQDPLLAEEAASLMYTLERVIAEDEFRQSHARAMQKH